MSQYGHSPSIPKDPRLRDFLEAVKQADNAIGKHDYIAGLDRFRHRESGDLLKASAILNLFRRSLPNRMREFDALYTEILGVRQYSALTFVPGAPENVVAEGRVTLNTWRRPATVPVEGDPRLFLEFVDLIFDGDAIAIEFFLDAIASLVQRPGMKWAFMILLIGGHPLLRRRLTGNTTNSSITTRSTSTESTGRSSGCTTKTTSGFSSR